jgi:hypothetical protein
MGGRTGVSGRPADSACPLGAGGRHTGAHVRPRGGVAGRGHINPDQRDRRRRWARWATGRCDDGWVLRTSLIGEIDAVLAAVDGLLGQWVPERALEFVLAGNASMSADSW